jgi:hypothetical protein
MIDPATFASLEGDALADAVSAAVTRLNRASSR